jgi:hypothetical protein
MVRRQGSLKKESGTGEVEIIVVEAVDASRVYRS